MIGCSRVTLSTLHFQGTLPIGDELGLCAPMFCIYMSNYPPFSRAVFLLLSGIYIANVLSSRTLNQFVSKLGSYANTVPFTVSYSVICVRSGYLFLSQDLATLLVTCPLKSLLAQQLLVSVRWISVVSIRYG